MPRPPRPSLASIVATAVPDPAGGRASAPGDASARRATLKERARQLSVYLEPPVYDQLRDLAHAERGKLHGLVLEGLDLLFKARGARSIKTLTDGR